MLRLVHVRQMCGRCGKWSGLFCKAHYVNESLFKKRLKNKCGQQIVDTLHIHVLEYLQSFVCVCARTHARVCAHVCVHVCVYVCVCVCCQWLV